MSDRDAEFVVVDVETTGFGKNDRVIEIGVVTLDHQFEIVDEYETLIDPERDLGPTHVHGITPRMISMAPSFCEVAPAIARRIDSRVVVAHNLSFDQRMIGQEYSRLEAMLDPGVGICTLKLTKQRLPAACRMLGLEPPQHHRALADARASALILKAIFPQCEHSPLRVQNVPGKLSARTHRRCADESTPVFERLLSRIVYREEDARLLEYMDLLDWVLDDFVVTTDERNRLDFLTEELCLTPLEVANAHEHYFQAMVEGASKDRIITQEEHVALKFVAQALGIATERVPAASPNACETSEIPPGSAICFTGSFVDCDGNPISKPTMENMATKHGFTVVGRVTKTNCDVVVAVDPQSASGKAKKARLYGKPVIASDEFLALIRAKQDRCLADS